MKLKYLGQVTENSPKFGAGDKSGTAYFCWTSFDAKELVKRWNAHEPLMEVALTLLKRNQDHDILDPLYHNEALACLIEATKEARVALLSLKETQ